MGKRIVVVDDEPDVLEVVVFRIEAMGYKVFSAATGSEGLALIQQEHPDLVLLDMRLPDMNGEELCKRIKAEESLRDMRVMFFTASSERIAEKCQELRADDFVVKPFDYAELQKKIKGLIG